MSREAVAGDVAIQEEVRAYATEYPKLFARYQSDLAAWQTEANQAKAEGKPEPKRKPQPISQPGLFCTGNGVQRDLAGARYDLKIQPVIPYAIRGFFWDQGEAGTGIGGAKTTTVLPALLRSWRASWGLGAIPFVYVRKSQYPPDREATMNGLAPTVMVARAHARPPPSG
jgi:sialate O-acetylesterase